MLDHIAVGPLAEQPAGKDAAPLVLARRAHVELDEGPDILLLLPRRRCLAGAQPHDRIAHAQRAAGFHLQITRQAVALVEQADHRDALTHRRNTRKIAHDRQWPRVTGLLHRIGRVGLRQLIRAVAAPLRREREQGHRQRSPHHDASGVHAS